MAFGIPQCLLRDAEDHPLHLRGKLACVPDHSECNPEAGALLNCPTFGAKGRNQAEVVKIAGLISWLVFRSSSETRSARRLASASCRPSAVSEIKIDRGQDSPQHGQSDCNGPSWRSIAMRRLSSSRAATVILA